MDTFSDAQAFEAWLVAKGQQVVGCAASSTGCPLALFLTEVLGGQWAVSTQMYHETARCWAGWLPTWAVKFVAVLDMWGGAPERADRCVSGEQARVALAYALADVDGRLLF